MRLDQFTVKAQEAIVAAQTAAEKTDHPEVTTEHLLGSLLGQEGGVVPSALGKLGANAGTVLGDVEKSLASLPRTQGAQTHVSAKLDGVLKQALREAESLKDEYVSTEHLLLALVGVEDPRRRALARAGVARDPLLRVLKDIRGNQRVTRPEPRGQVPGPREVRPRPHRARAQGQARPRDRPRRRDPPRRAGPLPPHEEQSGADRRARRRQDRDRRGPGPAHRGRRRTRGAEEQAGDRPRPRRAHRGGEVPRRVRGPPQGRAEGDHRVRRGDHPLHRRAPHARRRGRGRGRDGRVEHAEARRSPAASCAASARRRSTSTRSTSRRTPPSSGASSRCWSGEPTRRGHDRASCAG